MPHSQDDDRKTDIGYKTNAENTNIVCINTKAASRAPQFRRGERQYVWPAARSTVAF